MIAIAREAELLSAAGYLCNAVENLRAIGLVEFAEELDRYVAMLDVELLLKTAARHPTGS